MNTLGVFFHDFLTMVNLSISNEVSLNLAELEVYNYCYK